MGQQQKYLHNVASNVMGQIDLTVNVVKDGLKVLDSPVSEFPRTIWQNYGSRIVAVMRKMGPEARGRVASCGVNHFSPTGNVCHWEMNYGKDLNSAISGDELLTLLASYVVAAAILDILNAQLWSKIVKEQRAESSHRIREYFKKNSHVTPL